MKIAIFGSCVTRDAMEYAKDFPLELVGYYARSSLGSAFYQQKAEGFDFQEIPSSFQRRIVKFDFLKEFPDFLNNSEFDLIIYDPIDERFSLAKLKDDSLFTLSNEAKIIESQFGGDFRLIRSGSAEFYDLWELGWEAFIKKLDASGSRKKLRINKVYWSSVSECGDDFSPTFTKEKIGEHNKFLDRLYQRMEVDLCSEQFYAFDPIFFIGAENHKWGKSPFHYTDAYYKALTEKIFSNVKIGSMKSNQKENLSSNAKELLKSLLYKFNSNSILESDEIDFLRSSFHEDWLSLGDPSLTEIYRGDSAWEEYFSVDQSIKIKSLLSAMTSADFVGGIVLGALRSNKIEINSIFSDGLAICSQSVHIKNRNFLRFCDAQETFYIVQHHKFARALYFPLRSLVVVVDVIALPLDTIESLNSEVLRNIDLLNRNSRLSNETKFHGFIVSYPRPYHFFYDTLPVFYEFFRKSDCNEIRNKQIIHLECGHFFPVARFLGLDNVQEEVFVDSGGLNDASFKNNVFCLQVGYPEKRQFNFDELDAQLMDFSDNYRDYDQELEQKTQALNDCDVIVWFGICSEKRAWLEQVEGIVKIIDSIALWNKKIGIVFDGMTRTLLQDRELLRAEKCLAEINTMNSILKKLNAKVNYVHLDLIGASAVSKIYSAKIIDYFVTSFLTDSLYVARVAKKTGLAHGANLAMHLDHMHPNTFFVPKKYIEDVSPGKNWSAISYSISPDAIRNIFLNIINKSRVHIVTPRFFLPKKNIVRVSVGGYPASFKVSSIDKPVYASVNGSNVNFEKLSDGELAVSAGASYGFYFRGVSEIGVVCSLVIIGYSSSGRVMTETVLLGQNKDIIFSNEIENVRLFTRSKGDGGYTIEKIEILILDGSAVAPKNNIFPRQLPAVTETTYTYESLACFIAESKKSSGIHEVRLGDRKIEFKFIENESENLVVFFNAALSRTAHTKLPAFSGNSAVGTLPASILMVSDPSLYCSHDISLAWYAGDREVHTQKILSAIIVAFSKSHGKSKTILYGGSGGGFAAMYYASFVENSTAIVANPQTDITKYNKDSVFKYINDCYGNNDIAIENVQSILLENEITFRVSDLWRNSSYKLIYLQNLHDSHHLHNHLSTFVESIDVSQPDFNSTYFKSNDRIFFIFGKDWGKGHAAPPKKLIYGLLQHIVSSCDFDENQFKLCAERLYFESKSVINCCSLEVIDGNIFGTVSILENSESKNYKIAWYLYKDGVRIERTNYSEMSNAIFSSKASSGLYWATVFVRDSQGTVSLKSKKLKIANVEVSI